jgi:hypothetical protein
MEMRFRHVTLVGFPDRGRRMICRYEIHHEESLSGGGNGKSEVLAKSLENAQRPIYTRR